MSSKPAIKTVKSSSKTRAKSATRTTIAVRGARVHNLKNVSVEIPRDKLIVIVILGIVGAIAGGWLAGFFGLGGVSGLNLYSFVIAIVGSVVVLLVYHAIRRAV